MTTRFRLAWTARRRTPGQQAPQAPGSARIISRPGVKPQPSHSASATEQTSWPFLSNPAAAVLTGAAAAGAAHLGREIGEILALHAAHGEPALQTALERAVEFRRWRADDVRSILAAAGAAAPIAASPGDGGSVIRLDKPRGRYY